MTIEAAVDDLVGSLPSIMPELEGVELERFIQDMVQDIHSKGTVAARYGFNPPQLMVEYLRTHPTILNIIRKRKAVWESDGSAMDAARLEATVAVRQIIPHMTADAIDKKTTPAVRADIAKQISTIAGLSGGGAAKPGQAGSGNSLTFSIHFSDRTETITTTVVDQPPQVEAAQ